MNIKKLNEEIESLLNEEFVEFPDGHFGIDLSHQEVEELGINGNNYVYFITRPLPF